MNTFFPGKQGIYLENSIRQIGQILSAGFLNSLE